MTNIDYCARSEAMQSPLTLSVRMIRTSPSVRGKMHLGSVRGDKAGYNDPIDNPKRNLLCERPGFGD